MSRGRAFIIGAAVTASAIALFFPSISFDIICSRGDPREAVAGVAYLWHTSPVGYLVYLASGDPIIEYRGGSCIPDNTT